MTRQELADDTGLAYDTVVNIEHARTTISIEMMEAIALATGTTIASLAAAVDAKNRRKTLSRRKALYLPTGRVNPAQVSSGPLSDAELAGLDEQIVGIVPTADQPATSDEG